MPRDSPPNFRGIPTTKFLYVFFVYLFLVDVSDIFIFLLRGEEGGVRGDREGGVGLFLIENPRKGWGVSRRGGGEGAGRVSTDLGGGAKYFFFRGRNAANFLLPTFFLVLEPSFEKGAQPSRYQ